MTVAVSSNAIDLTSLAAVKNFAEITANKDDATIANLITAFSQWALTYTGRDTLNGIVTFTELYDGNGSPVLFTRNSPITLIRSVQVCNQSYPISSGFGSAGAYIRQTAKSIGLRGGSSGTFISQFYPSAGSPYIFIKGLGNIQVVYDAGYPPVPIGNDILTIAANTVTLSEGPWVSDLGVVYYPSLTPFVLVASAPAQGQYAVSNGLYVFNSLDNAQQVAVSYKIQQPPPDLEMCARRTVGVLCKRRSYLDQASKALAAQGTTGTTRYRDWKLTPEDQVTMVNYRRVALT